MSQRYNVEIERSVVAGDRQFAVESPHLCIHDGTNPISSRQAMQKTAPVPDFQRHVVRSALSGALQFVLVPGNVYSSTNQ